MSQPTGEHFGVEPNFFRIRSLGSDEPLDDALAHLRSLAVSGGDVVRQKYGLGEPEAPESLTALVPSMAALIDEKHPFNTVSAVRYRSKHIETRAVLDLLEPDEKDRYTGAIALVWLTPHSRVYLRGESDAVTCYYRTAVAVRADTHYRLGSPFSRTNSGELAIFGYDTELAS